MEETIGIVSAFYAIFPGNQKLNVFPMWLAEDHHARLSSVFVPHIGHPHSEDLDSEYLNIFETRTRTPRFSAASRTDFRSVVLPTPALPSNP
jgi:type IV secretion system protein VirB4